MPAPRRRQNPPRRWRPLTPLARRRLPSRVRPWLVDGGSLTRQLRCACGDGFAVRLLAQHWRFADESEARRLGIAARSRLIEREVQLTCRGRPLVYARSLIPLAALRGSHRELGAMGERPLGEKLFADPQMRRGSVHWRWLARGEARYRRALQGLTTRPPRLYGRCSLFHGAAAPVLVAEYFLPGLPRFPASRVVTPAGWPTAPPVA